MELFQAIKERHSYRGDFKQQPVPREHLEQIVKAGIKAPSGKNRQTTEFVIADNPDLLRQIRNAVPSNRPIQSAPAIIGCIMDREPEKIFHGYSFQVEDYAAATENMLLAITALGYASVWLDGMLRIEGRERKIAELLNIPENKQLRVILPVGIPVQTEKQAEKRAFSERAWYNSYRDGN